jgi:hypothetical protein
MRIKYLIVLMLSITSMVSQAQVGKSIPGYLGSRTAIGFRIMPNISFDEMFKDQLFSPSFHITYEKALSRRGSIYCSVGQAHNNLYSENYSRFRDANNVLYVVANNRTAKVNTFTGALRYKNTYLTLAM